MGRLCHVYVLPGAKEGGCGISRRSSSPNPFLLPAEYPHGGTGNKQVIDCGWLGCGSVFKSKGKRTLKR